MRSTCAEGIRGLPVPVDATDPGSVEEAVAAAAELGPLRIAVNCGGIGTAGKRIGRESPTPLESLSKVIEVNLLGTFNPLRCAPGVIDAGTAGPDGERGVCVSTASVTAFDGQVGPVAYAASDGGVVGLTLPVARESPSRRCTSCRSPWVCLKRR